MTWIKRNNYIFIIAFIAFLFISPQLFYHAPIIGADWWFHWSRFYETAMQIKHGNFNYFQSIYAFNQTGRVVNAMYGIDFAYFHGVLLLLFKNWYYAEVVSSFLCLFTAGISMYNLSKYTGLTKNISIINSIFFMGSTTIVFYVSNQGFAGWGTAFLPLAFIPVISMIKNPLKPINPVFFGGAVALLLEVHTFTTLMFILATIPFWLIGFYKTPYKYIMLKDSFLSIFVALALGSTAISGMLDVQKTNLIMPFKEPDLISKSSSLSASLMNRYDYGFIFTFIFIFSIIYVFSNFKSVLLMEKSVILIGASFLLISSPFFPWNSFANHFSALQTIQFPQRFGSIASVLLILGSSLLLQRSLTNIHFTRKQLVINAFLTLALINCTSGYSDIRQRASNWRSEDIQINGDKLVSNADKIRNNFSSPDLSKAFNTVRKSTPDYIPNYGKFDNPYSEYSKQIYDNKLVTKKEITNSNQLKITWNNNSNGETQLPVFVYKNSEIFLNNKKLNENEYNTSSIGTLIIRANNGKNTVVVGYKPSILFKIAIIIKISAVLLTILYLIRYKKI